MTNKILANENDEYAKHVAKIHYQFNDLKNDVYCQSIGDLTLLLNLAYKAFEKQVFKDLKE